MMIPCRHLDFADGKYDDCEIHTCAPDLPEVRYWQRGTRWTQGGGPANVQFCLLKGRINEILGCYGELPCYEQQEEKAGPSEPTEENLKE